MSCGVIPFWSSSSPLTGVLTLYCSFSHIWEDICTSEVVLLCSCTFLLGDNLGTTNCNLKTHLHISSCTALYFQWLHLVSWFISPDGCPHIVIAASFVKFGGIGTDALWNCIVSFLYGEVLLSAIAHAVSFSPHSQTDNYLDHSSCLP